MSIIGSLPNSITDGDPLDYVPLGANIAYIIAQVNANALAAANNLLDVVNPTTALANLAGMPLKLNFGSPISAATTLTSANVGQTFNVGDGAAAYDVTLPAPSSGLRFQFIGAGAGTYQVGLTWPTSGSLRLPDGTTVAFASLPYEGLNLSKYGTIISVWSDGIDWWLEGMFTPTQPAGDNSTKIATTDYADNYGIAAITGLAGTSVTLTASQYGRKIISLAGTLTANINLVFPTLEARWLVVNNTTGAYTITAKTSAGTGAKLSAGPNDVYCDGTNISVGALGYGVARTLCRIYENVAQSISANTLTKITFDTVDFDPDSIADVTTNIGRIQPKRAGYYRVNAGFGTGAGAGTAGTNIYKNGAAVMYGPTGTAVSGTGLHLQVSNIIYCNGVSDYLEIYALCTQAMTVASGSAQTFFSVEYLGA